MSLLYTASQANNSSTGIHIPVRSSKTYKGRNQITAIRIRHTLCKPVNLRRTRNQFQLITQPLDYCPSNKDTSLKRILNLALHSKRYCRKQLLRGNRLVAGIHKHKAAGSVSIFSITFIKTALTKKSCLLITNCRSKRNTKAADLRISLAVNAGRIANLRQKTARNPKQVQKLIIPVKLVNIKKHSAAGISIVGNMSTPSTKLPDKPGVNSTRKKLTSLSPLTQARHII